MLLPQSDPSLCRCLGNLDSTVRFVSYRVLVMRFDQLTREALSDEIIGELQGIKRNLQGKPWYLMKYIQGKPPLMKLQGNYKEFTRNLQGKLFCLMKYDKLFRKSHFRWFCRWWQKAQLGRGPFDQLLFWQEENSGNSGKRRSRRSFWQAAHREPPRMPPLMLMPPLYCCGYLHVFDRCHTIHIFYCQTTVSSNWSSYEHEESYFFIEDCDPRCMQLVQSDQHCIWSFWSP